jgi:hypothetical protein
MPESYILPLPFNLEYINGRAKNLKKPILHTDIEIPKSRSIHINMLNMIEEDNYESLNVLQPIVRDKIFFHNVEKLHNPIGKLRFTNKNLNTYNTELKKKYNKSRIVEEDDKLTITNRDLMVFNYKTLYVNNIYQVQQLKNHFIVENALNTLVHNINNSDFLHNMIFLDVPILFPTLNALTTDSRREMSITVLKHFPDLNSLVLLELWDMMFKDRDSKFSKIDKDKLSKVYLVFNNNNKYTIYRLNDLMSLSKELNVDGRFNGKDSLSAAKILIATLILFKQRSTISEELLKGVDGSVEDEVDFDKISDKELDMILKDAGMMDDVDVDAIPEEIIPIGEAKKDDTFKSEINNIDDAKDNLTKVIDKATIDKNISKGEATILTEILDTQLDQVFEINGVEQTLGEILDYSNVDKTNRAIPMPKSDVTLDEEMLANLNDNLDKRYIKDLYQKDIFNAIYSIQNGKMVITGHTINKRKSFMGEVEEHIIDVKPIGGGRAMPIKIILPAIDPDTGTYKMSSNEYLLRYQRKDLPIRKTSPTEVLLTSYAGKLFIEKNAMQKNNPSIWLSKAITIDDRFTNIILKKNKPFGLDLIKDYTSFGSTINRFNFNGIVFTFDYKNRLSLISDMITSDKVKELEKSEDMIFIGIKSNTYYYMKKDSTIVSIVSNNKTSLKQEASDIYTYLDINTKNMPNEYANISISGKTIPIGIILLYYVGLDKLLDMLKIEKRFYSKDEKYKLLDNEFSVELEDGKLVFDKRDRKAMLIFTGIMKEISKSLAVSDLSNKSSLSSVFNIMELSIAHSTQIDSIEDGFIDNITKDTLTEMGEPTDIHHLLIRAVELLVDDNYKNPNNITDNNIVRYERIAGMVYKTLNNAVKTYNTKNVLSRARLTVDPYAVWKMIGDDSTSMLITNNNPIDTIKQRDNITFLGEFGRSKITMTVGSRIMTPEEIGIISEASPDSGDSGINVYLTHAASIGNLRGMVNPIDMKDHSISKALSSANILNPFIVNDDAKRSNFASTQASHVIPMKVMKSYRIWTGAEPVLANKVGKPFVFTADDYGVVESISKSKVIVKYTKPDGKNIINLSSDDFNKPLVRDVYMYLLEKGYTIKFDDKANSKYKIFVGNSIIKDNKIISITNNKQIKEGLQNIPKVKTTEYSKTYSLRSWASKIEGNQSIKHNMTTVLRVGDKVEPGTAITYDESFFEPNIYDKKSIVIKMGCGYNVAFIEKKTTYEDSMEINSKILNDTGETKYKILSKVVDVTSHITNTLTEGTKVKYGDKLMTIIDSTLILDNTLTEQAKQILSEASDASPKANANGIIDRIDVIYNCELEAMDKSIRELADISNRRFKDEYGTDGKVTSEYSISGQPLLANQIELKYYISYQSDTKIGDKFNVGHQLKSTVGAIRTNIETEDGEQIDYIFSNKSVLARITNSGYIMGVMNVLMKDVTNKAIAAYRK